MKHVLLLLFLMVGISQAKAQGEPDVASSKPHRFYAGLGLTTINYHIYYKEPKSSGHVHTGYFAPVYLYLGYSVNDKMNLQVGLSYGGSTSKNDLFRQPQDSVKYNYYARTNVVAFSLSLQHVLFQVFRRFPIYATATLMPAYGMSKAKTEEVRNFGTTTYWVNEKGMDVFATAGLGCRFKISKCIQSYVEYLPFKHNITGENSFDRDWDQASPRFRRVIGSLNYGANYSF